MRRIKYLPIVLFALLFSCAGSEDENEKVMIVTDVDVSDFHMYIGSPEGAVEYKYYENVPEDKVDSVRSAIIGRRLSSYKKDLYAKYIIEFNGSKMTYTYIDTVSNSTRKLVAGYQFEGDSLFAIQSDTSKLFVALGDKPNTLYRMKGVARYRATTGDYVQQTNDAQYDLQSLLELYGRQFTDDKDTLIWLNAKYPFK